MLNSRRSAAGSRARTTLPALAAVLAILLGACSGGGDPQPTPRDTTSETPTPSPTPSPTPTPTTPPEPEPPTLPAVSRPDKAGRAEFTRYVVAAWVYAIRTNDMSALDEVSPPKGCGGCAPLAKELTKREQQGWYVALTGVGVGRPVDRTPRESTRQDPIATEVEIAIPESEVLNDDGSLRGISPAHERAIFATTFRFEAKTKKRPARFVLLSFGISDPPAKKDR